MPASLTRIRDSMSVKESPRGAGLVLNIRVVGYDNGMVEVDGIPINEGSARAKVRHDEGDGWVGACEVVTMTIHEFWRQVQARRSQKGVR